MNQEMNQAVVSYELPSPAISEDAKQMLDLSEMTEIDSQSTRDFVSVNLANIKGQHHKLSERRLAITRPLDAAKKSVMDLFKPALDYLEQAEAVCKRKILSYDRKVEEQRRAEQARLEREAAEARAKLDAEAKQRQEEAMAAVDAGDYTKAVEAAESADAMQRQAAAVVPIVLPPAVERTAGQSKRSEWKVKDIDLAALVKAAAADPQFLVYLSPNDKAINGVVRSLKGASAIPGVEVEEVEILSAFRGMTRN